jgi:predicted phage-related endonuclease
MKALETLNATEATVLAIAKATENAEASQLSTSEANLRIQNLERNVRKQEHKTNELSNQLKHNLQKNSKGSHVKESMTSPTQLTPPLNKHRNKTKRPLIDLTLEKSDEPP